VIKISVMYPNSSGERFDHDYSRSKHTPLIKLRMGSALKYYTIEKGLSGGTPDAPPTWKACSLGLTHRGRAEYKFGKHGPTVASACAGSRTVSYRHSAR
jgi:uncharacterized protein (TIGR02118 family)